MMTRWAILATLLALVSTPLVAQEEFPEPAERPVPTQSREDSEVAPAQYLLPGSSLPFDGRVDDGRMSAVVDPPTPVVRIQVRVPSHVTPGKALTYRILVANSSSADALNVLVRYPVPSSIAEIIKTDPSPDSRDGGATPTSLQWKLGTLRAGERKEIEVVVRPAEGAKEVKANAYVAFEHGQTVLTKIDRARLQVRKSAPKTSPQSESIVVRAEVENRGRTTIHGVELVEKISQGFDFAPETDGDRGSDSNQRIWAIGDLRPGQVRTITYKVNAKQAGDLLTTSFVRNTDDKETEQAESTTKVLSANMAVTLEGPATVAPGELAAYTLKVTNTGSMTLNAIRVGVSLPQDCVPVRMTSGGRRDRDQLTWNLPDPEGGPLRAGQTYAVRFSLKSSSSGARTVMVAAESGKLEANAEKTTTFQGAATLQWTKRIDPPTTAVGRDGLLTIRVTNPGNETARNVRLRIEMPPETRFKKAGPQGREVGEEVVFEPVAINPGATETFSVTFTSERTGQARFKLKLAADALGDRPMTSEQVVEIE